MLRFLSVYIKCTERSYHQYVLLKLCNTILSVFALQKVKSIAEAEKSPKAIDNWIDSITDLHRSKPPPNVHYTK